MRQWVKRGLRTTDGRRPVLILGPDLIEFLKARRESNKRPCSLGEIYCVRCRAPMRPAGDMADYKPVAINVGVLSGICPKCETMIYRRVNEAGLEQFRLILDVSMPKGLERIDARPEPIVNSALGAEGLERDQTQSR